MNQLKVFVSSTCYDLAQIRANLFDFISSIGHHPVLSEYTSFPIDPDNNTIENCIENVANADIFVLIIGSRYGHTIDSDKSITNTEYLYAKQNGIPIYIFIHKPLVTLLPVWKKNKDADFSDSVESVKVFEFVSSVRENNKNWCFDFENANDIVNTLKVQFSHLFKQSLDLRKKYRISDQPSFYQYLSARSLNIILKKELLYEALFFVNVLKDELEKYETLKLDFEYQILVTCKRELKDRSELINWLDINFESASYLINSFNNLLNNAFKTFYGEPGVPSDLKGLLYVAQSLARVFKEMCEWSIDIKSTKVPDDFLLIRDTLSNFMSLTIEKIWLYPRDSIQAMTDAIKKHKETNEPISLEATLTLEMDKNISEVFISEIERLQNNHF